ncbi:unnamed protein product [Thelazia callipaeda]|uniref:RNA-binding protein 28 n=1 Tax=Thelazia callipaeda TaxID=103827 RepID=A0A0N5CLZ8_THECL|nr:unnamed protein product [Thelazia callipaeda]
MNNSKNIMLHSVKIESVDDSSQKNATYLRNSRSKSWRLIVRNLPFKLTEEKLKSVFEAIGPCTEFVLPKCKDKRFPNSCAGFAFVQFQKRADAVKAIEVLNMTEIFGRKVALDWALSKDSYETAVYEERSNSQQVKKRVKIKIESSDSTDESKQQDDIKVIKDKDKIFSDEGERRIECDEVKHSFKEDEAVLEGRVLFIRNLSYDTTDEMLKEAFSKFGTVLLAVICRYMGNEHSKGTAFIHFQTAEQANECLKTISQDPGIFIDGRRVFGHCALPRSEAAKIERDKFARKPRDKRNLHLLRAGFIRPGTASAADMSKSDTDKRARLIISARKKLKNLHMFVSPTRLVVHNLPKSMTDKAFKSMCFIASSNPDAKITESRIWRDKSRLNASGEPISRGFGFVNFSEHKDALMALNNLNNNPEIFTKDKRPIVEFSIENLAAIRLREARLKKTQLKEFSDHNSVHDKNKLDLEQTKRYLSAGGRKPLPSRLGPKIRRKDTNSKIIETKEKAGAKRRQTVNIETAPKRKKISRSKQLTKYLTLSS